MMESKIIYQTFFIIILVQTSYGMTRKLNAELLSKTNNTFCWGQHQVLLYVKAVGCNDSLNYLWSFIENPSVLVALTPPSSKLHIKWQEVSPFPPEESITHHCIPTYISFDDPIFTYGMSIQKIYEFNDVNDTGNINSYNNANINILNPRYFKWFIKNKKFEDHFVELEMVGHSYFDPNANITRTGSITILVSTFGTLGRYSQKPSMLHSENSTQVDLSIETFETNKTFPNSRFAVEILLVSEGNVNTFVPVNVKKNIDDEHTPGVFEIMEIKTPPGNNVEWKNNVTMYLQWRPISYTTKIRDVTDSTKVFYYSLRKARNIFLDTFNTILYPYYQEKLDEIIVRRMNVSFGISEDGFYKKTGYNSWTFILGCSNPPDEQITSFTIMIISNVISLPLVLMIFHSSFTWYRKYKQRKVNSLIDRNLIGGNRNL